MSISTKIEPLDRDIQLILKETLSPEARSAMLAEFAQEAIGEAEEINRQVMGRVPRKTVSVDGRPGAELSTVKPDGVIVAEFELVTDALAWIGEQLVLHSPVLTGRFQDSHVLFLDGVQFDPAHKLIPPFKEAVFLNIQPYARKIERGLSQQAPDGVYQVVATLARSRFSNSVKVDFSYRTAIGGSIVGGRVGDRSRLRNPAIIVKPR